MLFTGRFSSRVGHVGIDFGAHSVRLVQVREQKGDLHLVGAAQLDLPVGRADDDSPATVPEASDLRSAIASGGFTGRRCVVALPRNTVRLQSVRLPKMPDGELLEAAGWEAAQRFNLRRDEIEVDFIRTGAELKSGESREEILLMAATRSDLNRYLEPVLAAGLRPVAVDADFAALARVYSRRARRETDRDQVRAVLEMGYTGARIMILRGPDIALCKPIDIGGRALNRAVAEHLQLDEDAARQLRFARISGMARAGGPRQDAASEDRGEGSHEPHEAVGADPATDRAVYEAVRPLLGDLVKEVMLCLRYYGVTFRGKSPGAIVLSGGDALEPRLDEILRDACKMQVRPDEPTSCLSSLIGPIQTMLHRAPGPSNCWAVATGLSMRGIAVRRKDADEPPAAAAEGAAPKQKKEAA